MYDPFAPQIKTFDNNQVMAMLRDSFYMTGHNHQEPYESELWRRGITKEQYLEWVKNNPSVAER